MSSAPIRKAVISAFGDVSNIAVVDSTIQPPAKGEVQVRVLYSGFSGADVNMRLGRYPLQRAAPLTPGYCFVGRVKANGPQCTKFATGAIVTAVTVYDAEAELANIPEKYLVPVPEKLAASDDGLQQAAALSLDWNTAYGMVAHAADVKPGQRVFIHGMSGAVGYAAMVLCQLRGAQVYGTASERNHTAIKKLGATPFVYTSKDWIGAMQALGGAHAVFDPLGFESWDESYSIVADKGCPGDKDGSGVLVGYGGNKATLEGGGEARSVWPHIAKLMARNMKVWSRKRTNFYYISRDDSTFAPDLCALMELCQEGKIRVPIKGVWDLTTEGVREAHESWGSIQGMGSMLIRVERES